MGFSLKKLIKKSVGLDPVTKKVAQVTKKVDPLARGALKANKLTQRVTGKVLGQTKRTGATPVARQNAGARAASMGKLGGKGRKMDY